MGSDDDHGKVVTVKSRLLRCFLLRCRRICLSSDNRKHFLILILFTLLVVGILFWKAGKTGTESVRTSLKNSASEISAVAKRKWDNQRLFYNRVPKCGSSTLVELLKKLAVRNGFTHTSSPLLDDWAIFSKDLQKDFAKEFNRAPPRSSFERHLFFLDFKEFGEKNPIYINMIRDPTERFISEFYFRRRLQKEGVKNGERQWYDEDLDNCVRTGKDYDCRLVDGTFIKNMIAFFCGNDIECSKHNSRTALARAISNVERHYAVVGILEDLEMTLKVLENELPNYFAGALDLHASSPDHIVNKGKNRAERVSDETRQIIRANLTVSMSCIISFSND